MKTLSILLVLALPAFGGQPKCKENPKVIGACYSVHARATYGNGTPAMRLWPVGTKRMLGVTAGPVADDADDPIFPAEISFGKDVESIYGDFEICPFTQEHPGAMRMVCIQSASHMVVKRFSNSRNSN
jgi:hypothetical protein